MAEFIDPDEIQEEGQQALPTESKFVDPDEVQEEPKKEAPKEGAFMSGVRGFTRGVEGAVEGTLQAGAKGLEKVGIPTERFQKQLATERAAKEAAYAESVRQHPLATRAGYLGGLIGTAGIVPGGVGGGIATRMATGGAAGAALGAAEYTDEGESRVKNALMGGVLGAGLPGLLGAAGAAKRGVKRLLPTKTKAAKEIAEDVVELTPGRAIEEASEAASKRTGISLTRGEATGAELVRAREGRIPMTRVMQKEVAKKVISREKAVEKQFDDVIDSIVPEGDKAAERTMNVLYKRAKTKSVDKDTVSELMTDPYFTKHYKKILRLRGDKIKASSVEHLDRIKRGLDDDISKATRAGENNLARELGEVKSSVIDSIEAVAPVYKTARQTAERVIFKRNILDDLNEISTKAGKSRATLDQVYDSMFKSPKMRDEFISKVEKLGGNTQQAKDVLTILNRINKSPIRKLMEKDPSLKSVKFGGGIQDTLTEGVRKLAAGRYNKALLDLSLDPKWEQEVAKIISKEGSTMSRMAALLAKVSAADKGDIENRNSSQIPKEVMENTKDTGLGMTSSPVLKNLINKSPTEASGKIINDKAIPKATSNKNPLIEDTIPSDKEINKLLKNIGPITDTEVEEAEDAKIRKMLKNIGPITDTEVEEAEAKAKKPRKFIESIPGKGIKDVLDEKTPREDKIRAFERKLPKKEAKEVSDFIEKNLSTPKKMQQYIKSLPKTKEGDKKRQMVHRITKAQKKLQGEKLTREEKLKRGAKEAAAFRKGLPKSLRGRKSRKGKKVPTYEEVHGDKGKTGNLLADLILVLVMALVGKKPSKGVKKSKKLRSKGRTTFAPESDAESPELTRLRNL